MKIELVNVGTKRFKIYYRPWHPYSTIHECIPGTDTGFKWLGRFPNFDIEDCVEMLRLKDGEDLEGHELAH